MSIAVSALVRPSRALRLLLGACGLAQLAAASAVGVFTPERFLWAPLQAALLGAAGAALLGSALARVKTQRLDISGTGDLRVTVQQDVGGEERVPAGAAMGAGSAGGETVHGAVSLLPGSVVWPALMSVRHAAPDARQNAWPNAWPNARPNAWQLAPPHTLLIARDSVDTASWRALAVALMVVGRAGMRTTDAKTR